MLPVVDQQQEIPENLSKILGTKIFFAVAIAASTQANLPHSLRFLIGIIAIFAFFYGPAKNKPAQLMLTMQHNTTNSVPVRRRPGGYLFGVNLGLLLSGLYCVGTSGWLFLVYDLNFFKRREATEQKLRYGILTSSGEIKKIDMNAFTWELPIVLRGIPEKDSSFFWPADLSDPGRVCVWQNKQEKTEDAKQSSSLDIPVRGVEKLFTCLIGKGSPPPSPVGRVLAKNEDSALIAVPFANSDRIESLYIFDFGQVTWKQIEKLPKARRWNLTASAVDSGWLLSWYEVRASGGYRVSAGWINHGSHDFHKLAVPLAESPFPEGLLTQGNAVFRAQSPHFSPFEKLLDTFSGGFLKGGLINGLEQIMGASEDEGSGGGGQATNYGRELPERNLARLWMWRANETRLDSMPVPKALGDATNLEIRNGALLKPIKLGRSGEQTRKEEKESGRIEKTGFELCSLKSFKCTTAFQLNVSLPGFDWRNVAFFSEAGESAHFISETSKLLWKKGPSHALEKMDVDFKRLGFLSDEANTLEFSFLDSKRILLSARNRQATENKGKTTSVDPVLLSWIEKTACRGIVSKFSPSCLRMRLLREGN